MNRWSMSICTLTISIINTRTGRLTHLENPTHTAIFTVSRFTATRTSRTFIIGIVTEDRSFRCLEDADSGLLGGGAVGDGEIEAV